MKIFLTTVGTSLLGNMKLKSQNQTPSETSLNKYLQDTKPTEASAETNSLFHLMQNEDCNDVCIVFIHSQTEDGKLCATALEKYYKSRGFSSSSIEICGLNYREAQFKMEGMKSLVDVFTKQISKAKKENQMVVINATGGFKAETAYATMVGLIFEVPVYYIHEMFKEIVEIPRIPLGWDYSLIADNEDFFVWIDSESRRYEEVEQRLKGIGRHSEIRMLLIQEDDCIYLSPAGDALFKGFKFEIDRAKQIPLFLSETALKFYNEAEPTKRMEFDRQFDRLRITNLRMQNSHQEPRCDTFVFPSGRYPERIFYTEDDGQLRVYELAIHDERYNRLIKKGVKRDNYLGHRFQLLDEK